MFFPSLTVAAEGATGPHLYSAVPEQYRNVALTALWAVYAYYRVMTNFWKALWHYFGGVLQVQVCTQVLQGRWVIRTNLTFLNGQLAFLPWHCRAQAGRSMEDRIKAYRILQILSSRCDESYDTISVSAAAYTIVSKL